jgi:phosphatidylglycerophosphatase A
MAGALAAFALGLWASARYAAAAGKDDPSEVVIDEVAAQWLVLAFLPLAPLPWLAGFALFRLFDAAKPWPVSLADRRLKGGFGIMADDMVAAGCTVLVIFVYRIVTEGF